MAANKLTALLGLDTKGFDSGLRGASSRVSEFGATFKQSLKDQSALIKHIEGDIKNLERSLKNTTPGLAKSNALKELGSAKRALREETASLIGMQNQEKASNEAALSRANTMTGAIGKWALSLGGVAAGFKLLKDAVLDTTPGINAFNVAGGVTKQVLHNIVTGQINWLKGVGTTVEVQKKLNKLRIVDKMALKESRKEQVEYDKALISANNQLLTAAERIKHYTEAQDHLNESIEIRERVVQIEIAETKKLAATHEGNEKYIMRVIELETELIDLDHRRWSGQKQIASMRSGLQKSELERLRKLAEANALLADRNKGADKVATHGLTGLPGIDNTGTLSGKEDSLKAVIDMTKELDAQSKAIGALTGGFDALFSSTEDGFKAMADSLIDSIKRIVAELAAKAAILGLITILFPGTAFGAQALTGLRNMGNLSNFGSGIGSGMATNSASKASAGSQQLSASISGKDVKFILDNRS